jgi:hypothetical protein
MREEETKAAFLQLCIATHAELLGVSRENLTIHNEIKRRNTKIVMSVDEICELRDVFEISGIFRVSVIQIE